MNKWWWNFIIFTTVAINSVLLCIKQCFVPNQMTDSLKVRIETDRDKETAQTKHKQAMFYANMFCFDWDYFMLLSPL